MLTKELFLFFLQNETGQSYYRDKKGNIFYTNTPTWLPEAPKGWYEQELTFGRNNHYWGLNRTYSQSFTFYSDGAEIIRYLFYANNGVEEKIYLSVLKLDH
uniref:hypothetical protein n=1 Tax=Hydrotalea sp. TaxID=2881279 RepID=UPI0026329F9D